MLQTNLNFNQFYIISIFLAFILISLEDITYFQNQILF